MEKRKRKKRGRKGFYQREPPSINRQSRQTFSKRGKKRGGGGGKERRSLWLPNPVSCFVAPRFTLIGGEERREKGKARFLYFK